MDYDNTDFLVTKTFFKSTNAYGGQILDDVNYQAPHLPQKYNGKALNNYHINFVKILLQLFPTDFFILLVSCWLYMYFWRGLIKKAS